MERQVTLKLDIGKSPCNVGNLHRRQVLELQQLASDLGGRLGRPISLPQAHSLGLSAIGEGAIKVPGGLWRGDWSDEKVVDAIAQYVGEIPPEELETLLTSAGSAECEEMYKGFLENQSDTKPELGYGDEPPPADCDGVGYPKEGFAMYIWPDSVPLWKPLASRLSWRLGRTLNYVHAFFLYAHMRHYGSWDDAWKPEGHCISSRKVADAIQAHMRLLEPGFLEELLVLPEFRQWEREHEQVLKDGTPPTAHLRMVVTTPMSVQHLVRSIDEDSKDTDQGGESAPASDDTGLQETRIAEVCAGAARKLGMLGKSQREMTVQYSASDDKMEFEDRHVPNWKQLARALGDRIGRELNFTHAAHLFGAALGDGELQCVNGRWRGCVYSPEVIEILAEYVAMAGPDELDWLLASRFHKQMAQEYKIRCQARKRPRRR